MKKLLAEPLLHFAVIGIALFVYFRAVSPPLPETADDGRIVVAEDDLQQMVSQYRSVWKRDPSRDELDGLVESVLREEVMVREALLLGLDRGDAAIRNRLRQKMQFLTDSAAQAMEPGDDVLRTHLEANGERFMTPATVSFEQVFLGQSPGEAEVREVMSLLQAGADPGSVGQGGLLPPGSPPASQAQVDGTFGRGFFDAVHLLAPGEWSGPVASGYGQHVVRVTDSSPASLPEFDSVRGNVLFDWRRTQAQALSDAQFEALRARYEVVLPDEAMLNRALAQ